MASAGQIGISVFVDSATFLSATDVQQHHPNPLTHLVRSEPWSSLEEGDEGHIGPSGKFCFTQTLENYSAHAWQHIGPSGKLLCL